MYILNKDKAKKILIEEEKRDELSVDRFLQDYPPLFDDLAVAVDKWLEGRSIMDIAVQGISIKEVMTVKKSNFLQAVKDLNVLFDPSNSSEKIEQWIRILRTTPVIE